ncbi:FlgD immunoglobulin-like domain containing protein [Candidatus Neomarinimicrobiota bacterium]
MKEEKLLFKSIRFFFIFAIIILFTFPLYATSTLVPDTDFEIDGNKTVEGLVDWETVMPLAGSPPFPIITNSSTDLTTGVYYLHTDPDLCETTSDDGGIGGTKLDDGASWPAGSSKAPAKDDLSAVWYATEKVYLDAGGSNDILYAAFERCSPQNGTMSAFIFIDNGDELTPSDGGANGVGDWLIVFDFDPSDGTMDMYLYMWLDTGGGVYNYVVQTIPAGSIEGYATPFVKGKGGDADTGGDFGEVAMNLTTLGITPVDGCGAVAVGDQTGTVAGLLTTSQVKDIVGTHELIVCGLDFDDLPDTYDPAIGSDPYACTTFNPYSPFIGAGVTNETNGWDDLEADEDTDDGIPGAWPLWEAGTCSGLLKTGIWGDVTMDVDTYCFTVQATNLSDSTAQLVAWIDWNDDGLFQDSERSELVLDGSTGNVPANSLDTTVVLYWEGVSPLFDETYARLRITTDSTFKSLTSPTPHGATSDGEIEGYLIPENTLPVELTSFTVEATDNGVLCKWTTESETENLGFILEKRTQGGNWAELASYKDDVEDNPLEGMGNYSGYKDYEYLDKLVQPNVTYEYRLADVDHKGVVTYQSTRIVTAGQTQQAAVIDKFAVAPAYPNPFNPSTTITYIIPNNDGTVVQVSVYDITGNLVRTLLNTKQESGNYSIVWDGKDNNGKIVPGGTYFSSIKYGNESKTIKMMMLK